MRAGATGGLRGLAYGGLRGQSDPNTAPPQYTLADFRMLTLYSRFS